MTELENAIEKYLISTIESLGGLCLKMVIPGRRGYPDRMCSIVPGVLFFVELKRPRGGVVARLQKVRAEELRAQGFRVYVGIKTRGELDVVIAAEATQYRSE
jgi:hypothetical protein